MAGFAVLLDAFEPSDFKLLASVLRDCTDLVGYDAVHRARNAHGFAAEDLDHDQATVLSQRLSEQGFACHIIQPQDVVQLERPRTIRNLQLRAESFGVALDLPRNVSWFPWTFLKVVSAGVIEYRQPQSKPKVRVSGSPPWQRRNVQSTVPRVVREEKREVVQADLLGETGDRSLLHFRLRASGLRYAEILGDEFRTTPEDRPKFTTVDNFCIVIARLVRAAETATVSEETTTLLASRRDSVVIPEDVRFANEDQFQAYNRWLLQWHRAAAGEEQ